MNHQNCPVSKAFKATRAILLSPFSLLKGVNEEKAEQMRATTKKKRQEVKMARLHLEAILKSKSSQALTHAEWLDLYPDTLSSPERWIESHLKWQEHIAAVS